MDNVVIGVAILSVIGTLSGVWLGNWLQSRNIKQQRKWALQDQKREWVRMRKQEDLERVVAFVEGTLERVLKAKSVFDSWSSYSQEQSEKLLLETQEQVASAMPIIYTIMGKDKELSDLLVEFEHEKNEAFDALRVRDYSKWDDNARRIAEVAGLIRQRTNKLLEEGFD